MVPIGIILLWTAMGAFGIGGVIWQIISRKKRAKRMLALADEHGWSYNELEAQLEHHYRGFRPFGRGSARNARHVLRGKSDQTDFVFFQYEYTVSSGKSSQTYYWRVLDVKAPLSAPDLSLEKEKISHKIADALGGEDIDFESLQFSKKYWVKCQDRAFAYAVIHPEMMEFLLSIPADLWQWRGTRLLLVESGRMEPERVLPQLRNMQNFLAQIPRHLKAEYMGTA